MGCGSCGSHKNRSVSSKDYNFTGGVDIKSLNDRQINARLEAFKRRFCNNCKKRYECDYQMYVKCKTIK
jgi:hypothetical protein